MVGSKYFDARSVQDFAFPLCSALLRECNAKRDGLFIAVIEDDVVENSQDQTN